MESGLDTRFTCVWETWLTCAFLPTLQEVSEMLGGRISVQDEEEVEDELAALEASVAAEDAIRNPPKPHKLPKVPDTELPVPQGAEEEEPEAQQPIRTRQPMLAS